MTTTFPIPASRRTFVRVLSLGRNVEVEVLKCYWRGDEHVAKVCSIDPIQPKPFYIPATIFPTEFAIVPTSSVIIVLEEGTGPTIDMAEETDAEHRTNTEDLHYPGVNM
jgi:hypothetical protein